MFAIDPRRALGHLAMGLVVFVVCYGAPTWFGHTAAVSTVWPANALVLAYILRYARSKPSMAASLLVAGAAMALANIVTDRPLITTIGFPVANVIEIGLAAWFMRAVFLPMSQTRDLRQFFLGAVVAGPLACALLAAPLIGLAHGVEGEALLRAGASWLVSDMIGMAVVVPFALSLGQVEKGGWTRALLAPAIIGVLAFLLCFQRSVPILFLAYPMVCAAVMRDRARGAALGIGAITVALLGAAAVDAGPVANLARLGLNPVLAVQVFLGCLVLTVYPMATLVRRLDVHAVEVERRRDAAVADSAAKSRVITQVGEELLSPLAGVVTVAEMLKSGRLGDLNDRQRDLLVRIAESGAEIETLSREMMSLADDGALAARSAPLADIVEEAVAASRFRAHRLGVSIEALTGDAAWRVAIDGDRLRRLVLGAITAALEAAPARSAVRVVAGLDGDSMLILTIDDAGAQSLADRHARFEVSRLIGPAADGTAFDRVELRKHGGDLRFGPGALGGGRLTIILPRVREAGEIQAA
jgi:signal transduction histidine kinase